MTEIITELDLENFMENIGRVYDIKKDKTRRKTKTSLDADCQFVDYIEVCLPISQKDLIKTVNMMHEPFANTFPAHVYKSTTGYIKTNVSKYKITYTVYYDQE